MFAQQCTRQLSASPPPVFSYPSMSPYDAYRQSTYAQSPIYHAAPNTYNEIAYQTEYGSAVPSLVPVLPSMQRKLAYDEDLISPFSMSYATMAGIDLCQQSQTHPEGLPVHIPRWVIFFIKKKKHTSPDQPLIWISRFHRLHTATRISEHHRLHQRHLSLHFRLRRNQRPVLLARCLDCMNTIYGRKVSKDWSAGISAPGPKRTPTVDRNSLVFFFSFFLFAFIFASPLEPFFWALLMSIWIRVTR